MPCSNLEFILHNITEETLSIPYFIPCVLLSHSHILFCILSLVSTSCYEEIETPATQCQPHSPSPFLKRLSQGGWCAPPSWPKEPPPMTPPTHAQPSRYQKHNNNTIVVAHKTSWLATLDCLVAIRKKDGHLESSITISPNSSGYLSGRYFQSA